MKQHITGEQYKELDMVQRGEWNRVTYFHNKEYDLDHNPWQLPNIGQMIEFLKEQTPNGEFKLDLQTHKGAELVDVLWEAVKHKLTNL